MSCLAGWEARIISCPGEVCWQTKKGGGVFFLSTTAKCGYILSYRCKSRDCCILIKGSVPLKTLVCLGHGSDKSGRLCGEVSEDVTLFGETGLTRITDSMGDAPDDAYNKWETGLMSIIDLGEKSLKMSLYF